MAAPAWELRDSGLTVGRRRNRHSDLPLFVWPRTRCCSVTATRLRPQP
jgi:hypothetical protein